MACNCYFDLNQKYTIAVNLELPLYTIAVKQGSMVLIAVYCCSKTGSTAVFNGLKVP